MNCPPMVGDDAPGCSETQARAAARLLGCEEWLEDARRRGRIDPLPGVRHGKLHISARREYAVRQAAGRLRFDRAEAKRQLAASIHRLRSIGSEVEHHKL